MTQKILFFIFLVSTFAYGAEIKTVNFLQEGEVSKFVLEFDGDDIQAERFHVTEDKQIILDLKNVKLANKLLRGIDTSEFPGSTVYISGYKKAGTNSDYRFAIQLRDNVRSILERSGKKLVLNIENRFGVFSKNKIQPEVVDPLKGNDSVTDAIGLNVPKSNSLDDILENLTLSGPKKYVGKKITVNVDNLPVPELLNIIAETSGFNIIIDPDISKSQPLTLSLTNIPWDQALDTVMSISNVVATKKGNILVLKTYDNAAREKDNELKALSQTKALEPMVTKVFLINYAALADISKIVKDYLTLPNPQTNQIAGTIQTDDRTNSIIIRDTVDVIERIKKVIETLDTQTPQIMIESKIVEATENYSKRIGLTRGITFGYDPVVNSSTTVNTGPGFSFSTAPTATAAEVGGLSLAVFKRLANLNFNLQLMESETKAKVISSPKVMTQNKRRASITSTETTSFRVQQVATGNQPALATFQEIPATLNLSVLPQVTNDGAISMEIQLTKSAFGVRPSNDAPPNTTQRSINTNVLVENGSTVVIGGLYTNATLQSVSGIPVLKDLPLIGWLFRTPINPDNTKNELVIFLTPRILNQDEAGFTERQSAQGVGDNSKI